VLRRTDGSWVRPERREKEGVTTQEVLVNYAVCSSRLQMKKMCRKRFMPTVRSADTWRQFQPKGAK
jgi:hypothetical protein